MLPLFQLFTEHNTDQVLRTRFASFPNFTLLGMLITLFRTPGTVLLLRLRPIASRLSAR